MNGTNKIIKKSIAKEPFGNRFKKTNIEGFFATPIIQSGLYFVKKFCKEIFFVLNFFLLYDKISMYVLKSLQHNAHYVIYL